MLVPHYVADWLKEEFGLEVAEDDILEDLPLDLRLAVMFKADLEAAYGDAAHYDAWSHVAYNVHLTLTQTQSDGITYWVSATRSSPEDLLNDAILPVKKRLANVR